MVNVNTNGILQLDNDKKARPVLEVLCLRFPAILRKIFRIMDDQSLAECKGINKIMKKFFDEERFYWIRVIQKYSKNLEEFSKSWNRVIQKTQTEVLKELANASHHFFQFRSSRYEKQWSPLHVSAD